MAIDKSIKLLLSREPGQVTATQEQFLQIAERNLLRLTGLINDILDISRLESGKMPLKTEATPIARVVDEVTKNLEGWAGTKSITVIKKIPSTPLQANCDPERIEHVLTNLIGNAIKFTPRDGKITIEAAGESGMIKVSVEDTGPGVIQQDRQKIFDKFYQSAARAPTDIAGTGLGLAIAKEIIDLHGGRIWVEGEEGRGAKFVFTIPAVQA